MSETSISPHDLPLCDIVMEGGITSGVVYPKATVKLSEKFRIKNIGGTSAGAIAAAATAAAELGRLRDPTGNPGYKRLAGLADELSNKGFSSKEATRLQDLFQPQKKTRPLFTLLISAIGNKSKIGIAVGLLRSFPLKVSAAFVLPLVLAKTLGHQDVFTWIATILISMISVVAVAGHSIWKTLTGPVVNNGYGICKGHDIEAEKLSCGDIREPLTLWLSRLLNECAGKDPDGPPLTFGELWKGTEDERSAPPEWLKNAGLTEWRYIDLQMITTNVTHGRPYRFPFKDDDQKLYFDKTELLQWFPSNVVNHMIENSAKATEGKYLLPDPEHLPVVFATRLSLSFPFLLSAVPLYATDFENPVVAQRKIERCWFSDGGICSNFPIHFFDSPLPMWPTFGIALESELKRYWSIDQDLSDNPTVTKDDKNRFFFPLSNKDGRGDSWARFDEEVDGGKKFIGFASNLLDTARNWRDRMLTRSPGVRDRVVRIYLKDTEGGLNLNMKKNLIKGLSTAGEVAATMLAERFEPASKDPMNLDNHRWIRLRNLAAVAEQDLSSLHRAISATHPGLAPWSDLICTPKGEDQYPIDTRQEQKLQELLDNLNIISLSSFTPPSMQNNAPKRTPVIRIVPNI